MYVVLIDGKLTELKYQDLSLSIIDFHNKKFAKVEGEYEVGFSPSNEQVNAAIREVRRVYYSEISDHTRNEWLYEKESGNDQHSLIKDKWLSEVANIKAETPFI